MLSSARAVHVTAKDTAGTATVEIFRTAILKARALCLATGLLLAGTVTASATTINNASFETGLTGWNVQTLSGSFCTAPVSATAGASCGFSLFNVAPTDGTHALHHGFDGTAGIIRVGQDITVTAGEEIVSFDYRAGWNFTGFGGLATLPRWFSVNIETAGGGANLATFNIFATGVEPETVLDTGDLTGSVDLSAFVGQTIRFSFDWIIPQSSTGPGHFQLDNLTVSAAEALPEPTPLAVLGVAFAALSIARRRTTRKA
jgi:hypothetical protein